tara:strand:- start:2135 stop:2245 length:111 start_codon:yes stop_codon:yes gene_type:complete
MLIFFFPDFDKNAKKKVPQNVVKKVDEREGTLLTRL